MFFLGLLSTPLPYLLLAAFYFFGFAMGMFNNNTGEDSAEPVAAVTIPIETKQKATDHSVYYFQINDQLQNQTDLLNQENTVSSYPPDTGPKIYQFRNTKVHEFYFSGFQFSRPPPSGC